VRKEIQVLLVRKEPRALKVFKDLWVLGDTLALRVREALRDYLALDILE